MNFRQNVKKLQTALIIETQEYITALKELTDDIIKGVSSAENEATVVSTFEIELFSFIKDVHSIKYYPKKEKRVGTVRHTSKGRIDSKIGALVIEFKHYTKLKTISQKEDASRQLIEYLEGLFIEYKTDYLGLITDGTQCKFIRMENNFIYEEAYEKLNYKHVNRLIKTIILLDKVALTPKNLVKDFCEPKYDNLAHQLTIKLFNILNKQATGRSKMLFHEWKELFRLAHDDKSKQKAIEERKESLENILRRKLISAEEEYMILYAIQTTFAIIVKIIAFKVISKIRFHKSLINFEQLSNADIETLRIQMFSLEEGAIFRSMGIGNLLEGDFFAWYSSKKQWNYDIGKTIQNIFSVLSKYEDKAIFETGNNVKDLFKDLYQNIMPAKVRHSLGEFYTPSWLADNLVTESINLINKKDTWTALDPCAGSGTFLTVLIKKVLDKNSHLSPTERLREVLKRVKAIDLNPLAVLTARINYFINISPLITDDFNFEIPVYLGDASYVPEDVYIDGVSCFRYKLQTLKGFINIEIPKSAVLNAEEFSRVMTDIEDDIQNHDKDSIINKIKNIIDDKDKKESILKSIEILADKFIELEKRDWNGIWARIVTNFLTTANLGKFDIIIGNPPWIDWKNLPAGYRERIKTICVERHLFSGDSITGGINLNICALITNVAAQNWLKENGVLAFLMPQYLIFQQSYEGFRRLILNGKRRLYFQHLFDWTKSGHPFKPVQQKFLSYFFQDKPQKYSSGISLKYFIKKKNYLLQNFNDCTSYEEIKNVFETKDVLVGQANPGNTIFSYAENREELSKFKKISGKSFYLGREGIEFYPQELFLLEIDKDLSAPDNKLYLTNFQNPKSKYKIPKETHLIEKIYLKPLIKGVNIERFHTTESNYLVPFPYEKTNPRSPISLIDLQKKSPLLANYFKRFKTVIESQTEYNDRIIGKKHNKEFYSLARVGKYSFAEHYVVFRDNTKWQAAVVSSLNTNWGGKIIPSFQNHAVSICETEKGRFITLVEAHYICAILNAPITKKYLINSSDSRSFKIRPPVFIPEFDSHNETHLKLSQLSKQAHSVFNDKSEMLMIDMQLDLLYINLKENSIFN